MVQWIIRAMLRVCLIGLFTLLAASLALAQHTMPQGATKPESKTKAPAAKGSDTTAGATSGEASQGAGGAGMGCMMMSMGGGAGESGCCRGGAGKGMSQGGMRMGAGGQGMGQGGMRMQGGMAQGQMAQRGAMAMQGQGQVQPQAAARPGTGHQGFGRGMPTSAVAGAPGMGPRRGARTQDPQMTEHRDTVHGLLTNNKRIRRSVELLPDGIRSTTESDDSETAALLKKHVPQMYQFIKEGKPVRRWDPLFEEIFKNGDKIKMTVQETDKGVKVTETSNDEKVVALIQEHSKIIDNFIATGWDSAQQEHPVPAKAKGER